jgi:hypothetical protein
VVIKIFGVRQGFQSNAVGDDVRAELDKSKERKAGGADHVSKQPEPLLTLPAESENASPRHPHH